MFNKQGQYSDRGMNVINKIKENNEALIEMLISEGVNPAEISYAFATQINYIIATAKMKQNFIEPEPEPEPEPRYFTNVLGFINDVSYLKAYPNGDVEAIHNDGTIKKCFVGIEDCEGYVKIGCWVELTESELKNIKDYQTRYFIHATAFGDSTVYIKADVDGKVYSVDINGKESDTHLKRSFCIETARKGVWIEVDRRDV